jgi:hypothetical protein
MDRFPGSETGRGNRAADRHREKGLLLALLLGDLLGSLLLLLRHGDGSLPRVPELKPSTDPSGTLLKGPDDVPDTDPIDLPAGFSGGRQHPLGEGRTIVIARAQSRLKTSFTSPRRMPPKRIDSDAMKPSLKEL